jgi:hypothetical protein
MANPIEPPAYTSGPFAPRFKNVRGAIPSRTLRDVQGGGSSSEPGALISSDAPSSESYLRYDLGDGQGMREWQTGREPSMGTVSMMTAPENVDRVTVGSPMDDLDIASALAGRRRELAMMQPYTGQELPPATVGEMAARARTMESAQDTLARLEQRFGNIEGVRERFLKEQLAAGRSQDDARMEADDYAMRLERRALMAEQLAQGRGLPSSAFDRRY